MSCDAGVRLPGRGGCAREDQKGRIYGFAFCDRFVSQLESVSISSSSTTASSGKGRGTGPASGAVGSRSSFADGAACRLPCFITGEATHEACLLARDARMNVIAAGHYATETVGVRALMPLFRRRFGVKTRFIDVPTGMWFK